MLLKPKTTLILAVFALFSCVEPSLTFANIALPLSSPGIPGERIGVVAGVKGDVEIISPGKAGRVVGSGEDVFIGDKVSTDSEGHLQIMLLDQTIFTIGSNSTIVIDEFIYNPANHEGKVKAKILQGTFRFITGKIAHKKPSNMEVELPSGTIGIRGTMVIGEVIGDQSTVVLAGPGPENNAGYKEGGFYLRNNVQGKEKKVEVTTTTYGSQIAGKGAPPSESFKVKQTVIDEWSKRLSLEEEAGTGEDGKRQADGKAGPPTTQSRRGGEGSDPDKATTRTDTIGDRGSEGKTGAEANAGPGANTGRSAPPAGTVRTRTSPVSSTVGQMAGQNTFGARGTLKGLRTIRQLTSRLGEESKKAAERAAQETVSGTGGSSSGSTTRDQLRALAAQNAGTEHFTQSGVNIANGTYTIALNINFDSKSIGGGQSRISGVLNSTNPSTTGIDFNLPDRSMGQGAIDATYLFTGLDNQNIGGCDCKANVKVAFNNTSSGIADGLEHSVTVIDSTSNAVLGSGSGGTTGRQTGATV